MMNYHTPLSYAETVNSATYRNALNATFIEFGDDFESADISSGVYDASLSVGADESVLNKLKIEIAAHATSSEILGRFAVLAAAEESDFADEMVDFGIGEIGPVATNSKIRSLFDRHTDPAEFLRATAQLFKKTARDPSALGPENPATAIHYACELAENSKSKITFDEEVLQEVDYIFTVLEKTTRADSLNTIELTNILKSSELLGGDLSESQHRLIRRLSAKSIDVMTEVTGRMYLRYLSNVPSEYLNTQDLLLFQVIQEKVPVFARSAMARETMRATANFPIDQLPTNEIVNTLRKCDQLYDAQGALDKLVYIQSLYEILTKLSVESSEDKQRIQLGRSIGRLFEQRYADATAEIHSLLTSENDPARREEYENRFRSFMHSMKRIRQSQ